MHVPCDINKAHKMSWGFQAIYLVYHGLDAIGGGSSQMNGVEGCEYAL